jgi:ribonuclease HI
MQAPAPVRDSSFPQPDPHRPGHVLISVPLRYTLTVDASLNQTQQKIGIGIVIQETVLAGRRGPIAEQIAESFPVGTVTTGEIELLAILRAVEIAVSRGYQWVKVRSDCNQLRKKVASGVKNKNQGKAGTVQGRILELARSIQNLQIAYCPRRKNQMAHRLARQGAGIIVPKAKPPTT